MQAWSDTNHKGMDVSHHNKDIDWTKVKASGEIEFVFIKATEGATGDDEKFRRNSAGANAVGIPCGYYHYARPENNKPLPEVENFMSAVKGLPAQLPYVLDVEGGASKIDAVALTEWVDFWLTQVKKATGKDVMIYTGASFAKSYLRAPLSKYPLWVAHYGCHGTPMGNSTWDRWSVFQHTSSGKVPGVPSASVDLNVMEKDFYDKYVGGTKPLTQFKDVPVGHPSEIYISSLKSAGVIAGNSATEFGFGEAVTKEQLAIILGRFDAYLKGVKP